MLSPLQSTELWLPPVAGEKNLGKLAIILPLLDWDPIDRILRERLHNAGEAIVSIYPQLEPRVRSVRGRFRYLFAYLELRPINAADEDAIIVGVHFQLSTNTGLSKILIEGDISREESGEILYSDSRTSIQSVIDSQAVRDAATQLVDLLIKQLFSLPRSTFAVNQ